MTYTRQIFVLVVLVLIGMAITGGWDVASSTAARPTEPTASASAVFEYSVLTTTFSLAEKGTDVRYTTVWDYSATQREITGQSVNSAEASYGPILNFLGGGTAQPDLQALLNALGKNGWRLEETEVHPGKTVRIFVRNAG